MHMNRLKKFLGSDRFRELFIYCVVGALTTLINYGVYIGVTHGWAALTGCAADHPTLILVATVAAWILSVAFAFWANKKYVFRSPGWSREVLRREVPGFVTARLLSLGFDVVFVEATVLLGMDHRIAKLLSNVIVVILNYFASKFWIFRRRDSR